MDLVFRVLLLPLVLWASAAMSGPVPPVDCVGGEACVEARYQHDAGLKRYADALELAVILTDFEAETGTVPMMFPVELVEDGAGPGGLVADAPDGPTPLWQLAVLGQPQAVDYVFETGSPFGFALTKDRGTRLREGMQEALGRPVDLPIDPQRVGTRFHPVYWIFLRPAHAGVPARWVVLVTFAQPVEHATKVADGVWMLGLTNHPEIGFAFPLIGLDAFSEAERAAIAADGAGADEIFARFAPVRLD